MDKSDTKNINLPEPNTQNGNVPGTKHDQNQEKRYGWPSFPKDPETGAAVTKSGELAQSTGSGPNLKTKIIPPADIKYLVENGVAPELIPNWNRDDPNSNWYVGYRKFTPERREIFLQKLEQTGRLMLAARFAGVNASTIRGHRKEDPEFDAACKEAEAMYHEMCVAGILHQARMGQIDEKYDKEGRVISRRVTYETQLRKMIVQRGDPSYQDTQKQEVSVTGGAVVVPAPIDSVESWEETVRRHMGGTVGGVEPADRLKAGGAAALETGRVVKRPVLDTSGAEVGTEADE